VKSNEIDDSVIKKTSRYFKAKIVENISLNKYFKILTVTPDQNQTFSENSLLVTRYSLLNPLPGQFYMLQAGDTCDPLLKKPFSIFKIGQRRAERQNDMILSFLYRIRGKGTLSLSRLKSGDIINVIGPLGNSYPEPYGDFIAVAGGIGIASLFPLLEKFSNRAYLFYGARNREELVMLNEVKALSKEIFIATDDGSEGQKGLVTDLLKNFFDASRITHNASRIYACGSTPMLKELSKLVTRYSLPCKCYVSLEEHMACGVGACLGCVTKVRRQASSVKRQASVVKKSDWIYERVCKEGPVFEIEDIVWE
jgi:dihydroorotate dehydrogenase electron transfer subunit